MYLYRSFPLLLNYCAVVQARVTSIVNREVAGSNPAWQGNPPVAQRSERYVPLSPIPRTVWSPQQGGGAGSGFFSGRA